MNLNWGVIVPLLTLLFGTLYKALIYRQDNIKLRMELEKYNDEKNPSFKKELADLED